MGKVIIFGSDGMLGRELVKMFKSDENYQVVSWDIKDVDVTDQHEVNAVMSKEMPDIVINTAAYNDVDGAEEDNKAFKLAKNINGFAPKYLAKAAKKQDAIFVQYVSDYVFDGKKGEYNENDKTSPISNYGDSKALGEKNVKEIGGKFYLIRTSKLFGKPAKFGNAKRSFFEVMMNLAKENDELKVVDSERSCFTYTPDLAKATKELIEGKYEFGIYHVVNEGAATWHEGLTELFKIAEVKNVKLIPVGSDEFPRPAKRPRSSVLLNTKFPKLRHYTEALKDWLK